MRRVAGILWIVVPLILLIGLAVLVGYWLALPHLNEISPSAGAMDAPAGASLRLRFSRPMRADEVQSRLEITPAVEGRFEWQGNTLLFTPMQPWPAGTEVQVTLQPGARPQGFLPLAMPSVREWSFTVRQPRLAFLSPSDGPAAVYLRIPGQADDQLLIQAAGGVEDFSVSPDGGFLYFTLNQPQGGSDIYRLDLGGRFSQVAGQPSSESATPLVVCAPAVCRLPMVSPDHEYLAYERTEAAQVGQESRSQIWLQPIDLGASDSFTPGDPPASGLSNDVPAGGEPAAPAEARAITDPSHMASLPSWSPQGLLTYYDADEEAFVLYSLNDGVQKTLPNATGQPGDWSPDGSGFVAPEIIFLDTNVSSTLQEQLEPLADSHLIWHSQPEGAALDLTQLEGIEDARPVFSPDGAQLAFARKYIDPARWSPGRQLWLMDVARRQARALTDDPNYNHIDFSWSPDGLRLAYVRFDQSALTLPPEVWVMDIQSGEATQILSGGYSPRWIP